MGSEVADLYVTLHTVEAPLTTGFARAGLSGEEMAGAITRSVAAVQADAAKASKSLTEVGVSAERMAEQTKVSSTGIVSAGDRILAEAAAIEAGGAKMAAAWQRDLAKMKAETAGLAHGMQSAQTQVNAAWKDLETAETNKTKQTAGNLAMVGVSAAAVGGIAVKMAGDFESATTRLVTSAGEDQKNLDLVRKGMLDLSGQVGSSAADLARAMYTIESGGQHGADGLLVLKAAAQGAKTENADLKTVADAVTSVLQDYHLKASDSADVTSKLVAAVGAGKTTFQELTGSLHSILPIASSAGISLSDITGALASMTVHGMSADQAAQNLADTVKHMLAPTQVQAKELGQLGMSAQDLAGMLSQKGLTGTLQTLSETILSRMGPSGKVMLDSFNQSKDAASAVNTMIGSMPQPVRQLAAEYHDGTISLSAYTKAMKALPADQAQLAKQYQSLEDRARGFSDQLKSGSPAAQSYQDALRRATGDATGLNTALMLTGENTGYVNKAVKTVAGTTTEAGGNVKGWAEIQGTFNQKMSEARAGLGAFAIQVGTALLPAIKLVADGLAKTAKWMGEHPALAKALAVALGAVALGFTAVAIAMWAASLTPIALIIGAIVVAVALLAFGIYELVTHWKDVEKFLSGAWTAFVNWGKGLWNDVAGFFKDVWKSIAGFFTDVWKGVSKGVSDAWDGIISFFKSVPGKIGSALDSLGSLLADLAKKGWDGFTHGLETAWKSTLKFLYDLPGNFFTGLGFLAGLLTRLAIDGWNGFTHGLKVAWDATVKFFKELPDRIHDFFLDIHNWIKKRGHELLVGFRDGVVDAWDATAKFFHDLPGNIHDFLLDIHNWIKKHGHDLLTGFWHGIVEAWDATVKFFHDLPGNIGRFFTGVWDWLVGHGRALLDGLGRGIGDGWNAVAQWFWDLPGNLWGFVKDAGTWLVDAGKNIVYGIWNGISSAAGWLWQKVKGFAGDVVHGFNAGIQSRSPSLLAAESGKFFVLGVALGIDNHANVAVAAAKALARGVVGAVSGMSGTVALDTALGGPLGGSSGGRAAPMVTGFGASAAPSATVVNVYIQPQGSIYAQNDLQRDVQKIVLQHAGRNTSAGWSPGVI